MTLTMRIFFIVFLISILCSAFTANAQTANDTAARNKHTPVQNINGVVDSIISTPEVDDSSYIDSVKEMIRQRFEDTVTTESDTIVPILVKKIQSITELIATANRLSEKGFDTLDISKNLPLTEQLLGIIELNFISRSAYQNLRALKSTKGILLQSEEQLEAWQNTLFEYAGAMANLKIKLTEVRNDPVLKKLPKDSLLRDIYFGQIAGLLVSWKKADSSVNIAMLQLGILENRVAANYLKTKNYLEKTNSKLSQYIGNLWIPEEPSLFSARQSDYDVSFREAYADSMISIGRLIGYFAALKIKFLVSTVLTILLLYAWLIRTFYTLKKREADAGYIIKNLSLVAKRPLLAVVGVVLLIIVLFFFNLPPSWNSFIWACLAIVFFILSKLDEKSKDLFQLRFLIVFLVFNNLNILIKNSLGERWLQFALDLVITGYAVCILRQVFKKATGYPTFIIRIMFVFVVFSAGAIITNLYGSFMLAKILNNGAVYALIAGIVLSIFTEVIVQMALLHDKVYKANKFVSYLNLCHLEQKMRKALHIVMIAAWLVILIQQLNLFDYAYEWVDEFLNDKRKLGNHSFSFGSILVFVLVIWFSAFLSKILLIFFGGKKEEATTSKKWVGSVLLLVRLGILLTGMIVAFLASGIPLDKIAIIVGALGVGIGFGLQNIVNNLVSGVILAFERPVQVGDAIEVGIHYGVIKEIGIRSSKLVTVEGSEVIVPNGDMLSQHIVNWTLSSHYRRVEVIVGVSYNTDLRLAENLLKEIIAVQTGVESSPPALVLAHNFSASSIDFRILFWCHIDTWIRIKSEVMMNIHKAFREHGIEIPFPQQDIHIKDAGSLLNNIGNQPG